MKTKVIKKNKCRRCSRGFTRFLNKLKDFYVKSMTELAYKVESGCGPTDINVSTLPKSFSTSSRRFSSSDQDLAELVKIASRRGLTKKAKFEFQNQQRSTHGSVSTNGVPHRRSVGMGKIDEDKAYDVNEIDGFNLNPIKYPRSKSHAVSSNRMF